MKQETHSNLNVTFRCVTKFEVMSFLAQIVLVQKLHWALTLLPIIAILVKKYRKIVGSGMEWKMLQPRFPNSWN